MTTNFETKYGSIPVSTVNIDDLDGWKVILSDTYKPDRGVYMLQKFYDDYPNLVSTCPDVDMLYKLCARSAKLGLWLKESNAQFVLEVAPPFYLKEMITPIEFSEASSIVIEINKTNRVLASEQEIIVNEFKRKMAQASDKQRKSVEKFNKNNIARIITLNSTALPVTLQAMIENYTPSSKSESPDRKTYAREVLISFKCSLVEFFKNPINAKVDFDSLLDELSEK